MTDMREKQLSADNDETRNSADLIRQELLQEINRLNRFSTVGLGRPKTGFFAVLHFVVFGKFLRLKFITE